MPRVFIFAQQVKEIIDAGKKEIAIPEGAIVSAAASDMIKEHQLNIKTTPPGAASPEDASETAEKSPNDQARVQRTDRQSPVSKEDNSDSPDRSPAQISEQALEALANRVVERIKEMQHGGPDKAARKKDAATQSQSSPANDDDMVICRCEEITKAAIKDAIRNGMRTLNGIKRITRAGMGLCQGQTCQRLVTQILAEELGLSSGEIEPTTARGPVRPLRLSVFANN